MSDHLFDDEHVALPGLHSEFVDNNENKPKTFKNCAMSMERTNETSLLPQTNTLPHSNTSTSSHNHSVKVNGVLNNFHEDVTTFDPINLRQYQNHLDRFSVDLSGMSEYFRANGVHNIEAPNDAVHSDVDNVGVQPQNDVSPNANSSVKHPSPSCRSNGSFYKLEQVPSVTGTTSDATTENDLSDDGYMDELEALGCFDNGAQMFYNSVAIRGPPTSSANLEVADDLGDFIETDIPRRNLSNSSRSSCSNDSRASSCEELSAMIGTKGSMKDSDSLTRTAGTTCKGWLDPHNNSIENNEDCFDEVVSSNSVVHEVERHPSDTAGNNGGSCAAFSPHGSNDLSQVSDRCESNSSSIRPSSYAGQLSRPTAAKCSNDIASNYVANRALKVLELNCVDTNGSGRACELNGACASVSVCSQRTSDSSLELDFEYTKSPDVLNESESDGTPILALSPMEDEIATGMIFTARTLSIDRCVGFANADNDIVPLGNEVSSPVNFVQGCDEASTDDIMPIRRHSHGNMLDNIEQNLASKRAQDKRVDWMMINSFSAEDSPREYPVASSTATGSHCGCNYCSCTTASSLRCHCLCHSKRTVSDEAPSAAFNGISAYPSSSSPGRRLKYVNGRTGTLGGVTRKRSEGNVTGDGLSWYSDDEETERNTDSLSSGEVAGSAYARKQSQRFNLFSRSRTVKQTAADKVVDCSCWDSTSLSLLKPPQVNGRQRDTSIGMKMSRRMCINLYEISTNNIDGQDSSSTTANGQKVATNTPNDASLKRGDMLNTFNPEWKSQDSNEDISVKRSTMCAMNAVSSVLKALNVDYNRTTLFELMSTMNSSGGASNMTSLTDYLISSSKEGVVAEEVIACTESVTNNEVYGRFFEIPPSSTSSGSMDVDLPKWLNGWMSKGAVPLATLNLTACTKNAVSRSTLIGPDAWHHQIINSLGDEICLMDEMRRSLTEEELVADLRGSSTVLISRTDVVSRWNDECNLSVLITHTDSRWRALNVIGQVVNMLRERQMVIEGGYRPQQTAQVTVPTRFKAGITLFVRTGTRVHSELVNADPTIPL